MTSPKTNLSYISLPILGLIKFFTIDVRFANNAIERTLRIKHLKTQNKWSFCV